MVLFSSVIEFFASASAVVSGTPPDGCDIDGSMYGIMTSGAVRVDGPASALPYSLGRVRDVPYGWNRPVCVRLVLAGLVLG